MSVDIYASSPKQQPDAETATSEPQLQLNVTQPPKNTINYSTKPPPRYRSFPVAGNYQLRHTFVKKATELEHFSAGIFDLLAFDEDFAKQALLYEGYRVNSLLLVCQSPQNFIRVYGELFLAYQEDPKRTESPTLTHTAYSSRPHTCQIWRLNDSFNFQIPVDQNIYFTHPGNNPRFHQAGRFFIATLLDYDTGDENFYDPNLVFTLMANIDFFCPTLVVTSNQNNYTVVWHGLDTTSGQLQLSDFGATLKATLQLSSNPVPGHISFLNDVVYAIDSEDGKFHYENTIATGIIALEDEVSTLTIDVSPALKFNYDDTIAYIVTLYAKNSPYTLTTIINNAS